MLDQAFEALKTYDWGTDHNVLKPIDDACVDSHGKADERKQLEERLLVTLKSEVSRDAKDYVCRKLMLIGTAASVPTLVELVPNADLSHMARYPLERMPAPEAGNALRDVLPKVSGKLKVGVISSLGVRGEAASVAPLAALLGDSDAAVAAAAAVALADIGNADAAKALADAKPAGDEAKEAVADARLVSAESLLAAGDKTAALTAYKGVMASNPSKLVRLAATRGMLACAGKKE